LEILHFVYAEDGNVDARAKAVKQAKGEEAWRSAVEVYAGSAFDCTIEIQKRFRA
jgi:hypothetical protein